MGKQACLLPKLDVGGSNPLARCVSQKTPRDDSRCPLASFVANSATVKALRDRLVSLAILPIAERHPAPSWSPLAPENAPRASNRSPVDMLQASQLLLIGTIVKADRWQEQIESGEYRRGRPGPGPRRRPDIRRPIAAANRPRAQQHRGHPAGPRTGRNHPREAAQEPACVLEAAAGDMGD